MINRDMSNALAPIPKEMRGQNELIKAQGLTLDCLTTRIEACI